MSKWYSSSKKRGTTGGNTYAIVNGQTIEREKAVQVKNPRTGLQMAQRVKWANLVFFWTLSGLAMLKGFIDKKKNQSWFNAFMSLNLGVPGTYLTKAEAAAKTCIAAPYYVARGPLSHAPISEITNPDIEFLLSIGTTKPTTIGALSLLIVNQWSGWVNGDKLCILVTVQDSVDNNVVTSFAKAELVLDVASTASLPLGFEIGGAGTTESPYIFNFSAAAAGVQDFNSAAVVHTRKRANKISTSTEQMVIVNEAGNDHRTEVYKQTAITSYDADAPVFYDPDAE